MRDDTLKRNNEDDSDHNLEHLKKNYVVSVTLVGPSYHYKKKYGAGQCVGRKLVYHHRT